MLSLQKNQENMGIRIAADSVKYTGSGTGFVEYKLQNAPDMNCPITSAQLDKGSFGWSEPSKKWFLNNVSYTLFTGPVDTTRQLYINRSDLNWCVSFLIFIEDDYVGNVYALRCAWDDESVVSFSHIAGDHDSDFIFTGDDDSVYIGFTVALSRLMVVSDNPLNLNIVV